MKIMKRTIEMGDGHYQMNKTSNLTEKHTHHLPTKNTHKYDNTTLLTGRLVLLRALIAALFSP